MAAGPWARLSALLLLALAIPATALRTPSAPSGAARPAGPARKGRLAVVVCGLQDRLLWRSKVSRVVAPAVRAGHAVDVYLDVVASGAQDDKDSFSRVFGQVKSPEATVDDLAAALEEGISGAGGRLAYFLARPAPEELRLPTGRAARRLPARLSKYPPSSDPIGRNLLRRYTSAERLMKLVLASGVHYDFVLWTRDDDHWLGPLELDRFLEDPHAQWRLYSKACLTFDGVNDKTLLFGRAAAEAMLAHLASDFWLRDRRLEHAKNAESFLKAFAEVKGVEPVAVPFGQLPTADSVYMRPVEGAQPQLCQKDRYLCEGLPEEPGFERPVACGRPAGAEGAPSPGGSPAPDAKSALAVVNYWSYPEPERRKPRAAALKRTLEALTTFPLRVRALLVTNEQAPEADGLVDEQIVRPVQRCSRSLTDPLCMAWEAMRILRNASTGGPAGCDLWHQGACGELKYDYYLYLEGDIEIPAATFNFWSAHVDGLFRQAYILVPHREEPFGGKQKLTECIRNHLVDHLEKTHVLRDERGGDELYEDPRDRFYLQPPVPYSACLLLSRWQFEVYRQGDAWDYDVVSRRLAGGKIREAAIKGLLADARLAKLRAVTHVKLPVLHQQRMTGAGGLYPDMCDAAAYVAKVEDCSIGLRTCPPL